MHYPKNSSLSALLHRTAAQRSSDLPFVLFSKPGDVNLHGVFQNEDTLYTTKGFGEAGFVMAPFDRDGPAIRIVPDEKIMAPYSTSETVPAKTGRASTGTEDEQKKSYLDLVRKALTEIERGNLKKVVISRFLQVPFNKDILETFLAFVSQYTNAFCYLWSHPRTGVWLGATPEVLVKTQGKTFTTVSLAGTQKNRNNRSPIWSAKELNEQELVTEYIQDVLRDKIVSLNRSKLESVRAGNLWHLRTKISGTVLENGAGNILKGLHPTPAGCGIPFLDARDFLLKEENYDREFYTGFLGEVDKEGNTEFYVNLRCAQIKKNLAYVYVGGGITKDSEPEKEWLETVAKSETLLKFLR